MSGEALDFERSTRLPLGWSDKPRPRSNALAGYAAAVGLVALAVLLGFVAQQVIAAANVTLVFVLPVIVAATSFGFFPALAAAVLGVLAFDFFFTQPLYSLRIHNAADTWAAALLLVIAAIVSTVAADARRRALEGGREADRANALHRLAHLLVEAAPSAEVARATAETLAQIFQAPAVVLSERSGKLEVIAASEGARLSSVDHEAANWALAKATPSRGQNYPFDSSAFDFWPIARESAPGLVLGVRSGDDDARPPQPAKYVELAGAYLAAGLTAPARRP